MQFRNTFNFFLSLFIIFLFIYYVPLAYDLFVTFSVAIVAIKSAEWLMTTTRKRVLFKTLSPNNKAVFITGCASGIGSALAKRMDKLGYRVYAGCHHPEGEAAKDLINYCSSNLKVFSLDVTSYQSIQEAKKFISGDLDQNALVLWAIVNNAGVVEVGEIDWTPLEDLQRVNDVNATGTLRVIKAFLPFIKKSKGRIVNNTSICGRLICPGFVSYCMSKAASIALTNGLRIELAKWGVEAISIEAFIYTTPLTSPKALLEKSDKTWKKAQKETKEDYGEHYKNYFDECLTNLLSVSNPNVYEVIDCFEDAITAEEPMSSYFACSPFYKLGIKILLTMSNKVSEIYQRTYVEKVKPAALLK